MIGFLGTNLDAGQGAGRWQRWRPSVDLCMRENFLIDRYELLYEEEFSELAEQVMADMRQVSPETEVVGRKLGIKQAWDFENVFGRLYDYSRQAIPKGDEWQTYVHITTGTHVAQICLFLLTESRHFPGRLIQTSPPRGRKQGRMLGGMTMIDLDLSKYDQLASRFHEEKLEAQDLLKSGIATRNKAFNQLIEQIETVALRSQAPLLLTGPTGAGKSQLAQQIYQLKESRTGLEGDFVEVNCATLRGDMAMSTLFGHKKGAFTGAQTDRAGLLREAHKGMLFLDEIGELGLDEQAMLLRAIEEGRWLPVGSDQVVKSNFQLIAGTNKDLLAEVSEGNFREDLLARINTWMFRLPGLAERTEDIAPNVDYELGKHATKSGQSVTFNKEALDKFLTFASNPSSTWRGNFRDLNAAITRMATLASHGRITSQEVEDEKRRLEQNWHQPKLQRTEAAELTDYLNENEVAHIDPFDRPQLAYVISVCKESRTLSEAGRKLFSVSREQRKTKNDGDRLRKYLAKFSLQFEEL